MTLFSKSQSQAQGLPPISNAPIAKALQELPSDSRSKFKIKFELAHFVAMERSNHKGNAKGKGRLVTCFQNNV